MLPPGRSTSPVVIQRQKVQVKLSEDKESDLTHKSGEGQKVRRKQLLPGEPECGKTDCMLTRKETAQKGWGLPL